MIAWPAFSVTAECRVYSIRPASTVALCVIISLKDYRWIFRDDGLQASRNLLKTD